MPLKRKRRQRPRNRNYRKRVRKNLPPIVNTTRYIGFPSQMIAKLRYSDYLQLTPGVSGVVDEQVYKLNSIWDPDHTNNGTNHQPMYRDNFAAVYNHYIVIGARAKCQFTNLDQNNPCSVGLVWDRGGSVDTDELSIMEGGKGSSTVLTPLGGSKDTVTLTYLFDAKRFFGVKMLEADDMGANTGQEPAAKAYVAAWVGGLGTDTGQCQLLVNIDYIVKFTRLKDQDVLN